MNAPEYWWVLSMSASCLYTLSAGTEYQQSFVGRIPILRTKPDLLNVGILLPLLLALCVLGLSDWLTEQSFTVWLSKLEEFGKCIGILLSLQALYFLLHGRVYGRWLLLMVSALTFQLWLYYQSLGLDFHSLGQIYALILFVVLVIINIVLQAIHRNIRLAFARPLACLVLLAQWGFSTTSISDSTTVDFDWLSIETTLLPLGLMLIIILLGYSGQSWLSRFNRISGS